MKNFKNGMLIGLFVNFCVTIVISLIYGTGEYITVTPRLISAYGNELNATIFQGLVTMIFGGLCAVTSVYFDNEHTPLIQKTAQHFLITAVTFTIMAKLNYWFVWNFKFLTALYFSFILIYVVIWSVSYLYNKRLVTAFNKKLNNWHWI